LDSEGIVHMVNSLYRRVSRKRVCSICGKPDWCSYTPDGSASFCARVNNRADRISPTGWGVYFHDTLPKVTSAAPPFPILTNKSRRTSGLAPIDVRDFVYRQLIALAPASNSIEIVSGPKGLNERKIHNVENYGSLPKNYHKRDELAEYIFELVRGKFPGFLKKQKTTNTYIPGFWTDVRGRPRLWRQKDYSVPMLLIPFQDVDGLIQACQIRFMGNPAEKRPRYIWFSTPDKLNGGGCGTPLHFARYNKDSVNKAILVTEGVLKAETLKGFSAGQDIIASAGVSCSHDRIISAARFRSLLIGFDADKNENRHVARAVARLLLLRHADQKSYSYDDTVHILTWNSEFRGIDDAHLAKSPISQISPKGWFEALSHCCQQEVRRYIETTDTSRQFVLTSVLK